MPKKQIAILGGAFNPITEGHVALAKFVFRNVKDLNEIWFSPCYKHMFNKELTSYQDRYNMTLISIRDETFSFKIFSERDIGTPLHATTQCDGSTYSLIKYLEKYTDCEFSLIIGEDNANTIHLWKNYKWLINHVRFIVVPRKGIARDKSVKWYCKKPHIVFGENVSTKIIQISSTEIRNKLLQNRNRKPRGLNSKVYKYILERGLYKGDI